MSRESINAVVLSAVEDAKELLVLTNKRIDQIFIDNPDFTDEEK